MKVKKYRGSIILVLGVLIGIVGYWTVDVTEDRALFIAVLKILGPGAFFGAMLSAFIQKGRPYFNTLVISSGVTIGMLSRIIWDMIQNPSSHNFFPFELMIGLAIVLPAAFLGSFLIYVIYFIAGKK